MMWITINIAISAFDIYIIVSFYYRRLKRRMAVRYIVLLWAVCVILHYWMHYLELPILWGSLSSAAICLIMTFMFEASWKRRFFYPLVITALEVVAEIAAGLMVSGFLNKVVNLFELTPYVMEYQMGKVVSKLVFFIFVRTLCRLHVMNDAMLPLRHWLLIMMVPVTSTAVCIGYAFCFEHCISENLIAPLVILIGMMTVNTLAFTIYDELSAQSKELVEHERAKNRMESDLRQYSAIISQSKDFASLLHDTRKHREAVYDLLIAGDSHSALQYMTGLLVPGSLLYHDTIAENSPAVDMLLRRKISEAERNGVTVDCHFEAENALPVDDLSLCLIIGNALDNAIEACKKLPDGKKRQIDIDVRRQESRLTIRIANTSEPVKIVNNSCETTKSNHMQHGYGLSNIQQTVAEKDGNSVIHYENGMFILSVVFPL